MHAFQPDYQSHLGRNTEFPPIFSKLKKEYSLGRAQWVDYLHRMYEGLSLTNPPSTIQRISIWYTSERLVQRVEDSRIDPSMVWHTYVYVHVVYHIWTWWQKSGDNLNICKRRKKILIKSNVPLWGKIWEDRDGGSILQYILQGTTNNGNLHFLARKLLFAKERGHYRKKKVQPIKMQSSRIQSQQSHRIHLQNITPKAQGTFQKSG